MKAIPRSLFRFRPFNSFTLDELCSEDIHYADPATFNDPLDSRPNLVLDSDFQTLVALHAKATERLRGNLFASDWKYLATEDGPVGSKEYQPQPSDRLMVRNSSAEPSEGSAAD